MYWIKEKPDFKTNVNIPNLFYKIICVNKDMFTIYNKKNKGDGITYLKTIDDFLQMIKTNHPEVYANLQEVLKQQVPFKDGNSGTNEQYKLFRDIETNNEMIKNTCSFKKYKCGEKK